MADAPPWPNFSLLHYYAILLCPIIIIHLLALLPVYVCQLASLRRIRQYVGMVRYLKVWKHYPPPRKKRLSSASTRNTWRSRKAVTPPTPRLTVFVVGWFFYIMSCRIEMCCHRAARMMSGHSQVFRRYQACAAQSKRDQDQALFVLIPTLTQLELMAMRHAAWETTPTNLKISS